MKTKLNILIFFLFSIASWSQINESFESATPPATGWTYNSVTHGTNNPRTGIRCATFNASLDEVITPLITNPSQLSFWWRRSGTAPGTPVFQIFYGSSVTGPWTQIGSDITSFTTTYQNFTADISSLSNIYIRVLHTRTSAANEVYIDDFSVTTLAATPTVTGTPSSLTFNYALGAGPSTEQTFTTSGTNLTNNIVIDAPANFEISTTSGAGFTNSITLTPNAGTVNTSTIYIRLISGLTVGAYNTSINITSTGATSKTVTLNGSVSGSQNSDIIAVNSSEANTISSTMNDATPLTATTGTLVWQFKVRDGGATLNDSDSASTTLTNLTISKSTGNQVTSWFDAIKTIALFDGSNLIATGTVNATTGVYSIVFSGMNFIVPDNSERILSLKMSLNCGIGTSNFDGDDFGFSITNANTTFLPSGSGKTTFSVQSSLNGKIIIDVVATKLNFTIQPSNSGIGAIMTPYVKVNATDNCGNLDKNFNNSITITSSGSLSGTTSSATAINGIATFTNLTHSAAGIGLFLTASYSGLTSGTSSTFNISNITILKPGDVGILAFNTDIGGSVDEISFVTFVDVLPNTIIDITDNAYQKCGTLNGWGISEGWIRLQRFNTTLTKGTIITVNITNGVPSIVSPDPSNWTTSKPQPVGQGVFDMNANGEQIFFMTGGNVGGPNLTTATSDQGTYSGSFLFGFNTKGNVWTPVCGDSGTGGTKNSDKPIGFDCFVAYPTAQADRNKYTGFMTPASQRDWIERINNPSNWSGYANTTDYTAGPNFYGASIVINTGGFQNGMWIGNVSSDWFECSNWQSLKVPDEFMNVTLDSNSAQNAVIDYTAPSSDLYGDVAKCNDLIIANKSVVIEANPLNIIEVHGNLSITSSGSLDMDDSNSTTSDGQLYLYQNWNNTVGNAAFSEGNGTVNFVGTTNQVIGNVSPEGTETFYNVNLDNNFNTSISNNIIATGNLEVKPNRQLIIDSNNYIQVNKDLTVNGTVTVNNNGSIIQVENTGINTGNITYKRDASLRQLDYTYISAPIAVSKSPFVGFNIDNISATPASLTYEWNPTAYSTDAGQNYGNWVWSGGSTMTLGKGYTVSAPSSFSPTTAGTFSMSYFGIPNNGLINATISRGTNTNPTIITTQNNSQINNITDNFNLLGNPYPSAISASQFLFDNKLKLNGNLSLWTHGNLPVYSQSPYYDNFVFNYTDTDYFTYTFTGTSCCPAAPADIYIGAGQAFFVEMLDGVAGSDTVEFNNSMRKTSYTNNTFYKNTSYSSDSLVDIERHRIWVDINSPSNIAERALVGYIEGATSEKDQFFDYTAMLTGNLAIYTIDNSENYLIQGKALPFNENDSIPVGYYAPEQGSYNIAIGGLDGLFENQDIYLEDKFLNIIHNLKSSPYQFNSEIGINNNRFFLKFKDASLTTNTNELSNSVLVSTPNNNLNIKSSNQKIDSVTVFDLLGREIFKKENITNNEIKINSISAKNQVLVIKIKLENGVVSNKKIILN